MKAVILAALLASCVPAYALPPDPVRRNQETGIYEYTVQHCTDKDGYPEYMQSFAPGMQAITPVVRGNNPITELPVYYQIWQDATGAKYSFSQLSNAPDGPICLVMYIPGGDLL